MENKLFSSTDAQRIEEAIKVAEKKTNGEIVVHVTEQSDNYFSGVFACSLLLGGSSLVLAYVSSFFIPSLATEYAELFSIVVFAAAFALAYFIPSIRLLFISQNEIDRRVIQKAEQVFFEREIFQTKDRTGLLILISYLEHRVEVLGDSGINKQINQEQWVHIVDEITTGIKNNNASDGIIKGISLAADLLVTSDFHIKPDNENELPNTISFD